MYVVGLLNSITMAVAIILSHKAPDPIRAAANDY
jgi:hypothetical protein